MTVKQMNDVDVLKRLVIETAPRGAVEFRADLDRNKPLWECSWFYGEESETDDEAVCAHTFEDLMDKVRQVFEEKS